MRYDGETYDSYLATNTRYDVVVTPTGCDGMRTDSTWTSKTFTAESDMCVGTTSVSATSSKLKGRIYGEIVVDGRLKLIPAERISDALIGYYDVYSDTFYTPIGSNPTKIAYVT